VTGWSDALRAPHAYRPGGQRSSPHPAAVRHPAHGGCRDRGAHAGGQRAGSL